MFFYANAPKNTIKVWIGQQRPTVGLCLNSGVVLFKSLCLYQACEVPSASHSTALTASDIKLCLFVVPNCITCYFVDALRCVRTANKNMAAYNQPLAVGLGILWKIFGQFMEKVYFDWSK